MLKLLALLVSEIFKKIISWRRWRRTIALCETLALVHLIKCHKLWDIGRRCARKMWSLVHLKTVCHCNIAPIESSPMISQYMSIQSFALSDTVCVLFTKYQIKAPNWTPSFDSYDLPILHRLVTAHTASDDRQTAVRRQTNRTTRYRHQPKIGRHYKYFRNIPTPFWLQYPLRRTETIDI